MIQEKDFLYRVPVKNVLVTTPRQQVRNPEILVDLEGGEFMHGNILDANSTNKLINQSVKDAVDNKLIESGYVTKDLLDAETTRATEQENSLKTLIGAETSARTKGDEDLSAKIKAEQTRAEGKEKEISDKLAIVDGDSNTEGSFRKAIADVIAAAPEDLDTLKEIADKLTGNDDLHTALNQAITEKADASALLNEVTRATGAESALQAAIDTKADATSLSNYVLTAALNKQVDTLNAAISAKQDAGNYIPYESINDKTYVTKHGEGILFESGSGNVSIKDGEIKVKNSNRRVTVASSFIWLLGPNDNGEGSDTLFAELDKNGLRLRGGDNHHVLTAYGSTIDINQYAKKTELPTVPTAVSQLTNDSNFITAADIDFTPYATIEALTAETTARTEALTALEQKVTANTTAIEGKQDKGNYIPYLDDSNHGYTLNGDLRIGEEFSILTLSNTDITLRGPGESGFVLSSDAIEINNGQTVVIDPGQISSTENEVNQFKITPNSIILGNEGAPVVSISSEGIKFQGKTNSYIPTAGGAFIGIDHFAPMSEYKQKIAALEARVAALEAKLPKATA